MTRRLAVTVENIIRLDIVVPNETRYLSLIGEIAEALARALGDYHGDRDALAFHLNLVLTEALANAMEHSKPSDIGKTVKLCINIEGKDLNVNVYDQGQGFDLESIPTPDFQSLDERGRGVFLMRELMDAVSYSRTEAGNVLHMHKKLD
jgi:serine/threonine-protein kinase RsbW